MDTHFWQEKYRSQQTGWDLGEISPPLRAYFDQITNKNQSILIPGCGYGHEAIYLAQNGFTDVYAMDLVKEPLDFIQATEPKIHCLQASIFEHLGKYDLIIEQTIFCAIDPNNRQAYIEKVASLLKPGGKYVGVLFNRTFEGGPPFGGNAEEYSGYLENNFNSYSMEPCYNSAAPRNNFELFIIAKK